MDKKRVRITSLPTGTQGMQVRKEQTYLGGLPTNPNQYMEPETRVGSFITPVPRDEANIEAEKGETMVTPMGDDAQTRTIPKTFKIGGKRHHKGGTPLNVPDGTFIYSDHLKETNTQVHPIFGKKEKKTGYTYAELSRPYMLNEDIKRLVDTDSDKISINTAQMNIQNKIQKLSLLSVLQESKKGFGDGEEFDMPEIAMPYITKTGLNVADAVAPYLQAIQQTMPPEVAQQNQMQMTPAQQGMMRKGGPVKMQRGGQVGMELPKYQNAGEVTGLKPGHRVDRATGKIYDEAGREVGKVNYGNEGTQVTNSKKEVTSASIPSDAIVIKRSEYDTEGEYITARDKAFKEQGSAKPIYVQLADGKYKKVVAKAQTFEPYKGEMFETIFNKRQDVADQYYYIDQKFNSPEMKKVLQEKAIAVLNDKTNRRGVTDAAAKDMIKKLEADPELAYKQFMEMQKRNLGMMAHGYEASQFNNSPTKGKVTNKEFDEAFDKVGIKTPRWEDAALQQASYIAYQRLLDDRDAGKIEDSKIKDNLSRFTVTQVGKNDDIITGAAGKGMISAIDGIYTNTTAGQIAGIKNDPLISEEDPELRDIGTEKIKTNTIQGVTEQNPYGWRAPDIKRLATAAKWMTSDVPEMPWAKIPDYYIPNVYLESPDARAFNERGMIANTEDMLSRYSTPGALLAASSAMSGAGNVGQYISEVGNRNKETVNRHAYAVSDILNKAATERGQLATKTNENRQIVNEKHRAFKREAQKLFDDSFDWGWNQASRLATLNQRYRNFKVDPFTGVPYKTGQAVITPTTGQEEVLMSRLSTYVDKYPNMDQRVLLEAAKSDLGMDTKYSPVPQYMNYSNAATLPPDYSEYYEGNKPS